ncbi:CocE/NonD family hydrolase [Streptomyces sp. NPDC058464]|uniref:CocE/NonD family hydrolase n=1 Tax=Streptomyces sp. NPDC058464 TaxID=3346511 RepID=UPI00366A244C
MSLKSHMFQRSLRLSPPRTRDLTVERDVRVPMRDGAVLLADRWAPKSGGDGLPTLVIRVPYGRSGVLDHPRPFAERGFQVLIQSTRGTFGSDGPWDPQRREREDGLDTIEWVIRQPWFGESMVLYGSSYRGFVQWAVADAVPPQVKAMIPGITSADLLVGLLRGDSFSLETSFAWGVFVDGQERRFATLRSLLGGRKSRRALRTLPLNQADTAALGHPHEYIQSMLVHESDAPFWKGGDHRHRVVDALVPVSSVAGWYDIFLPGQLRDFRMLQEAGGMARLTVGPWDHSSAGVGRMTAAETLGFGLALARGEEPAERAPVRLFVMGEEKWRDFPLWPPPGYEPRRYHLQADGVLSPAPPADSSPDGYHYDPAAPTPAVGGVRLTSAMKAGRVDNTALEARRDVLTYTTPVLDKDVEVVGEVSAEIFFRSSLPYADVFVRLCDVDGKGRSTNVCDGLVSLANADKTSPADVRLWPTAHLFKRGHRIRVQVSSGAFPRYNRNPGTGEPRATATTLRPARQLVYHDPQHPSAIILPTR